MKLRNPIFNKFIISYLLLTIVPISLLAGYIIFDFSKTVKDSFIERNDSILKTTSDDIEGDIIDLRTLVISMSSDRIFHMMKPPFSDYDSLEIVEHLNRYKSSNGKFHDIALYLEYLDSIYAATGIYKDLDFYYRINFSAQPDESIFKNMQKFAIPKHVKNDIGSENYGIIYSYPYAGQSNGYVIFSFDRSTLSDTLKNAISDDKREDFVIFDNDYNLIAQANNIDAVAVCNFVKNYADEETYTSFVTMNGKKYLLSYMKSGSTGNIYAIISPSDIIAVSSKIFYILIMIALIFAISIFGIMYSLRENYLPIKRIINKITFNNKNSVSDLNELGKVVGKMVDTNLQLESFVNEKRFIIRNQLLQRLLSGQIENFEQLDEIAKEIKNKDENNRYTVVLVNCNEHDINKLYSFEEKLMLGFGTKIYNVDTLMSNIMVFVLTLTNDGAENLYELLCNLHKILENGIKGPVLISAGRVKSDMMQLSEAYTEASRGLEQRFITGKSGIIRYDDVIVKNDSIEQPHFDIDAFSRYIILCDVESVSKIVNETIESLKGFTVRMAKSVCYDAINSIIKVAQGLRVNFDNVLKRCYKLIMDMENITIEETSDEIRDICSELCNILINIRESDETALKYRIKKCVDDNIFNIDFSLESVADSFNMSCSYLSRFFKSNFDINMKDYIAMRRIEYAKELLKNTNLPITEIVRQTGYIDNSSFNRKFKAYVGCSPSEWRKLNG